MRVPSPKISCPRVGEFDDEKKNRKEFSKIGSEDFHAKKVISQRDL